MEISDKLIIAKPILNINKLDLSLIKNYNSIINVQYKQFLNDLLIDSTNKENYKLEESLNSDLEYLQFKKQENNVNIIGHIYSYRDLNNNHKIPQFLLLNFYSGSLFTSLDETYNQYNKKLNNNDCLNWRTFESKNEDLILKLNKINKDEKDSNNISKEIFNELILEELLI